MDDTIIKFLDKSRYCKTIDDLTNLLENCLENIGFPMWAYSTDYDTLDEENIPLVKHNYPKQWEQYYMDNNCFEVDPIVTEGKGKFLPFSWDEVMTKDSKLESEKEYESQSHSHGLKSGMAIPIIGGGGKFSMLSLATSDHNNEVQKLMNFKSDVIMALAFAFHSIAKDLLTVQGDKYEDILTKREKEIVTWTSHGKSSWEISKILNISERTVIFHLDNVKKKLNVNNKYHMVMKAVTMGLVKP